jgi:hypothetical protein
MLKPAIAAATLFLTALMTTQSLDPGSTHATFGDAVAFLEAHAKVIVLRDGDAQVAVVPAWQGRVMTSTAGGARGSSFGWLNRPVIASGTPQPHITVFGGEDRFWLGPEGGQFSIFFAKGQPFDLEHWFTPAPIDTRPYAVEAQSERSVALAAQFDVTNYSGTRFDVRVRREVKLLSSADAAAALGVAVAPDVRLVAFETDNRITNAGRAAWTKDTGLLSMWILGMFNPGAEATIVVPLVPGPDAELGPKVTSDYFGAVPPERLVVRDRAAFFSGDGTFRSKIGVGPRRSRGVLGSYDASARVLTIVQFTQPAGVTDYVNSQWALQERPFAGDASNAYNDGPPAPGEKPLGPFYELESSSPAAALAPGATAAHVHRTIHLSGPLPRLDAVAQKVLGVSLDEIRKALPRR